jgi:hypothetical protein
VIRVKTLRWRMAIPAVLAVASTGCFGPPQVEITEALTMARLLHEVAPESAALLLEEEHVAHELKIMLDEAEGGSVDSPRFKEHFQSDVERLSRIRDRRQALQNRIKQGIARTPLVNVVQDDAIQYFQEQLNRDDGWLQLINNIRLRETLGRPKDFPEMSVLSQSLELFNGETKEEPMASQILTLQAEYGFTDEEVEQ